MQSTKNPETTPVFCDRCLVQLRPGSGDHYVIRIEAVADPAPPVVTDKDLNQDLRGQIEATLSKLNELSPQEAMDQVHRRVVLHLCIRCYKQWIENPSG